MANLIKQIATNDDDSQVYGMVRTLTLMVFAFYHVMYFLDFWVNDNDFDGWKYTQGACGIIVLYACARSIREILPMIYRLKFGDKHDE